MPSPKSPLSVLPANPIHSRNSHHKRVPRPLAPPGQQVPATDAPGHARDAAETGMAMAVGMVPSPAGPMRTLAEAYADAHTHLHPYPNHPPPAAPSLAPRRSETLPVKDAKERERERERDRDREKKPLFDWLARKLTTAGRRPGIETTMSPKQPRSRTRLTSMPKPRALGLSGGKEEKETGRGESRARMSRADTFPSVSFSISSAANTLDRERRREANNPYPSLPLGQGLRGRHKQGFMDDAMTLSTTLSGGYSAENDGASGSGHGTASRRSSQSGVLDGFEEGDSGRADDDASLRPFPPSVRESPTLSSYRSRSNSMLHHSAYRRTIYSVSSAGGLDEDGASCDGSEDDADEDAQGADEGRSRQRRVSRDGSTSTKPTTCISFDSGPGIAHIAQGSHPNTSHRSASQHSLTQTGGGESIPNIHTSEASTPVSPTSPTSTSPASPPQPALGLLQAPKHTNPHPGHNPHPSSPPDPNASTLTLASSNFASSHTPGAGGTRSRDNGPSSVIASPSVLTWAEPSSTPLSVAGGVERERDRDRSAAEYPPSIQTMGHLSLYAPSVSVSLRGGLRGVSGERGEGGRADRDASVRAVRRKGSWESYESRWSWRGAGAGVGPGAGPSNAGTSQIAGAMTSGERDKGAAGANEGKELERVPESPLL